MDSEDKNKNENIGMGNIARPLDIIAGGSSSTSTRNANAMPFSSTVIHFPLSTASSDDNDKLSAPINIENNSEKDIKPVSDSQANLNVTNNNAINKWSISPINRESSEKETSQNTKEKKELLELNKIQKNIEKSEESTKIEIKKSSEFLQPEKELGQETVKEKKEKKGGFWSIFSGKKEKKEEKNISTPEVVSKDDDQTAKETDESSEAKNVDDIIKPAASPFVLSETAEIKKTEESAETEKSKEVSEIDNTKEVMPISSSLNLDKNTEVNNSNSIKPISAPFDLDDKNEIAQEETKSEGILNEEPKSRAGKEPCIKVDQIRVIYNMGKSNEVRSLDGVDVEIYPEEYIIIYGPSGCGKSTLLYGISGLQAPTYGDVVVLGKNLSQMTKREKVEFHQTKIGMVFQAFYLIETLTVLDNVCLPKVFRGENLKERREKAMELLRRFGIAEQADKFPAQLSGGQKQRVSIARALVNDPEIILADEPVGNLDSESAQNVLDIFKEINGTDRKTLIMVTHNPEHLVYADRIIHMKDGKKVREEINTDKRPKEAIKKEIALTPEEISSELKLLMRTFKNLSLQQIGVLLVPFKAKQVINHIISQLKDEQIIAAENFLKEFLFKNINGEELEQKLDLDLTKGGAGWNKLRATSFTNRVEDIINQTEILKKNEETSVLDFTDYLIRLFNVKVDEEIVLRFRNFVKLRVENKIDRFGLQQRLDAPRALGGVGLYKGSAEKIVDEIELIMLLKYSE